MRTTLVVVIAACLSPTPAWSDETDNFTCRARLTRDASAAVDGWMNAAIQRAVDGSNGTRNCGGDCLRQELIRHVGRNTRQAPTFIPHSALSRWIEREPGIERCRLKFSESIYGARAYNQPWLFPVNGRIIFLADSIRLSGTVIGVDKINHFLREGLAHWRAAEQGQRIDAIMAHELGVEGRPLLMTERGLRGMALTGVLAYADLAASYSGLRFWHDLLSTQASRSFIQRDEADGRFVQVRAFAFADYVTDAWDESINRSTFARGLSAQVAKRTANFPAADERCAFLAKFPGASLYLNPACAGAQLPDDNGQSGCPIVADDVSDGLFGYRGELAECGDVVSALHLNRPAAMRREHPARAVRNAQRVGRKGRFQRRPNGIEDSVTGETDPHAHAHEEPVRVPRADLRERQVERRADGIFLFDA
jgi:hypothetical protein